MKIFYYILMLVGLLYACKETIKPGEDQSKPTVVQTAISELKNVSVDEAKKIIASTSELIILDVRTPEETAEGIVEGAIEIDFLSDNFESEVSKLSKEVPYLVYCKSGGRSSQAGKHMIKNGFKTVYNMKGGYTDWK